MGGRLREREAEAHVGGICFKTGPPARTGVELEWLIHDREDPGRPVPPRRLGPALSALEAPGALPGGSRLTREPGGQVELSSAPATSLARCAAAASADLAALRNGLAGAGLVPAGLGLEPRLVPRRVLEHPRYRAMETYFDRIGPWGRVMMRATASVQISLDAGDESAGTRGYRYRWRLAHRIGPVLVAAFANSPLWQGRPSGWVSTRQAVWARLDPGRTRPPEPADDPRAAWTRYALDAGLLCVRRSSPAAWTAPEGVSFRAWLRGAAPGPGPGLDDLDYHLSTLFPPVRPRGWLELRMIDAQPGDGWRVPLAVASALLDDPAAADAAYEATEPLAGGPGTPAPGVWLRAARDGLADREVGRAARVCFAAAATALGRDPANGPLLRAVEAYADRYPERGRCPADDQLDAAGRARPPGAARRPGSVPGPPGRGRAGRAEHGGAGQEPDRVREPAPARAAPERAGEARRWKNGGRPGGEMSTA